MEKKVVKKIGPETELIAELTAEGKLKLSVDQKGSIGGAGAYVYGEAYEIIDAITDLIPGDWDDAMIDPIAKKFLKAE